MKNAVGTIAIPACEFEEMNSEIETLRAEKAKLELLVKYYEEQLRLAKHRQFGSSSEQTHSCGGEQLTLFNEAEALSDKSIEEPSLEQVISHTRRKSVGKREQDVSGLPMERMIHELPKGERNCPICGEALHACGHDMLRRELVVIPAQAKVVEHMQTVYACRTCDKTTTATPMRKAFPEHTAPAVGS